VGEAGVGEEDAVRPDDLAQLEEQVRAEGLPLRQDGGQRVRLAISVDIKVTVRRILDLGQPWVLESSRRHLV
jgi:hypothetical protein